MTNILIDTPSSGLLKVSGLDAKKFLQGQLTCDLEKITPEHSGIGAHCNPQGRVISLFKISLHQDSYLLMMPKSMIPIALAALKKYAVFFKVELSDASDTQEIAKDKLKNDITTGIPNIYPETTGKFLPHELNLPELGALSFDKGCYTGQEIIARMHYRGKLKTHMHLARIKHTTPIKPGSEIYYQANNETHAGGTLVDYVLESDNNYLALIITNDNHATDQHLFLEQNGQYFTLLKQQRE